VATAIAGSYRSEWAHGVFHEYTGWVAFAIAFFFTVIIHLSIHYGYRILRKRTA
jgi:hypothetical protein